MSFSDEFYALQEAVQSILLPSIGEDVTREGLKDTPKRYAKMLFEMTKGLREEPPTITLFDRKDHDQMVTVMNLDYYSLCVPSKQKVNAVGGSKQAHEVAVGDELWTLDDGRVVKTEVIAIQSRKTRSLVEVETDKGVFRVTHDHPFATPEGWIEARYLEGHEVEWTQPRSLHRVRPKIRTGRSVCGHDTTNGCKALYISDNWASKGGGRQGWNLKHGFEREDHRTSLLESTYVPVRRVQEVKAEGLKPFTVYSFTCDKGTFLIDGHLSHNCEHHIVPFFGKVHVGYLPKDKIAGLSKFGRVVDWVSHKPQTQEYMTGEIADYLVEKIDPKGLIVVVEGVHLCMAMRGVKKSQHKTITSAIRREIDKKEFLDILKGSR